MALVFNEQKVQCQVGSGCSALLRPGLKPNADGCTRNTSVKVVSSALRQRALAVKAVRVLNCQSVHSVFALLGPACWGQGASQSHPEGGACPNDGYTSTGNMSSSYFLSFFFGLAESAAASVLAIRLRPGSSTRPQRLAALSRARLPPAPRGAPRRKHANGRQRHAQRSSAAAPPCSPP